MDTKLKGWPRPFGGHTLLPIVPTGRGWLVLGLLLGTMAYAIAEELTLTTYYPSPAGSTSSETLSFLWGATL